MGYLEHLFDRQHNYMIMKKTTTTYFSPGLWCKWLTGLICWENNIVLIHFNHRKQRPAHRYTGQPKSLREKYLLGFDGCYWRSSWWTVCCHISTESTIRYLHAFLQSLKESRACCLHDVSSVYASLK